MIVTWRVANVATVIISIESITDVKTCNGVRTASDEEVQNSSSKVAEKKHSDQVQSCKLMVILSNVYVPPGGERQTSMECERLNTC